MARFPNPDPGRKEPKNLTWTFEGFKGGGIALGWIAGRTVWVEAHHRFVTKPCHSFMTGGKLECPYCGVWKVNLEQGYMPWLNEAGKPMCTAVRDYSKPLLKALPAFSPIRIRKGDTKFKPVIVERSKHAGLYSPDAATARTEEQFEDWLLTLWGDKALIDYFRTAPIVKAEPEPAAKVEADQGGEAVEPDRERELLKQFVRSRIEWPGKDQPAGPELVGEVIGHDPSVNGKRKPR